MPLDSQSENLRHGLAMFAKQPRPGFVKSRLAKETSPEWAASVAAAFLRDLTERWSSLPVRRLIAFDPPDAHDWFAELTQRRFELTAQVAGDLGERLAAFVHAQFSKGLERLVMLGMDSPTLPLSLVKQAFGLLREVDVVIGPATDGGYYLMGCRNDHPRLFQDIDWSGASVVNSTVARVRELGLTLQLLTPWYDVDRLEDWEMLCGHVAAMRAAGVDPELPHTERLIARQGEVRNDDQAV